MLENRVAAGGIVRGLGDLCPGWCAERVDGLLVARRVARLSDYQLGCGCLDEVSAGSVTELLLVCEAQNIFAERIAVAETTARGVSGSVS